MLKINKGKFVQIPNVAFGFGTDYKLNDDELKVLAYLQWMKNVGTMNVRTHVTIIVEDLGWTTTKASRDNTRVANALENLASKGYTTLSFNGDIKKNALAIEINIEEMKSAEAESTVDWRERPFKFSGYTEVSKDEYNLAVEHDYHLTVMAYHNWRANLDGYAIADQEWAEVLEFKTVKQARAIISDCDFLTKISGAYYQDNNGQMKQETNQYVKTAQVKSSVAEIESANKSVTYLEKQRQKVTDIFVSHDDEVFGQIFDKTKRLEWKGYRAWKETECDVVKKAGQAKIESILKNEKGKFVVERLENDYQSWLSNQKRAEAHMKRMEESMDDSDFENEAMWQERMERVREARKEKQKESDIMDFLD